MLYTALAKLLCDEINEIVGKLEKCISGYFETQKETLSSRGIPRLPQHFVTSFLMKSRQGCGKKSIIESLKNSLSIYSVKVLSMASVIQLIMN